MTKILAIDPGAQGGTTGVVLAEYARAIPFRIVDYTTVGGGYQGFKGFVHLSDWDWDVLVVEDYIPRMGVPNQSSEPPKIVGYAQAWGDMTHRKNVLQQPVERQYVTKDMLKAFDAYLKGGNHHDAREAARHALAYVLKQHSHATMHVLDSILNV